MTIIWKVLQHCLYSWCFYRTYIKYYSSRLYIRWNFLY